MRTLAGLVFVLSAVSLHASSPVGIYGVVQKVVLEPNDQAPERIQIWGAFAFVDRNDESASSVKRGYLYFKLPSDRRAAENARTEWKDIQSVAGTGRAIAFGDWIYKGNLFDLQSDARTSATTRPSIRLPEVGKPIADVRVRPESEAIDSPAIYATNFGVIELAGKGSHAEIVRKLKESLQ